MLDLTIKKDFDLKAFGKVYEKEMLNLLKATAFFISADIKKNITTGSRTGRKYQRVTSVSGVRYRIYKNFKPKGYSPSGALYGTRGQASARGEHPKTDTGNLASSSRFDLRHLRKGLVKVIVGDLKGKVMVDYAYELEAKLKRKIIIDQPTDIVKKKMDDFLNKISKKV